MLVDDALVLRCFSSVKDNKHSAYKNKLGGIIEGLMDVDCMRWGELHCGLEGQGLLESMIVTKGRQRRAVLGIRALQ